MGLGRSRCAGHVQRSGRPTTMRWPPAVRAVSAAAAGTPDCDGGDGGGAAANRAGGRLGTDC